MQPPPRPAITRSGCTPPSSIPPLPPLLCPFSPLKPQPLPSLHSSYPLPPWHSLFALWVSPGKGGRAHPGHRHGQVNECIFRAWPPQSSRGARPQEVYNAAVQQLERTLAPGSGMVRRPTRGLGSPRPGGMLRACCNMSGLRSVGSCFRGGRMGRMGVRGTALTAGLCAVRLQGQGDPARGSQPGPPRRSSIEGYRPVRPIVPREQP